MVRILVVFLVASGIMTLNTSMINSNNSNPKLLGKWKELERIDNTILYQRLDETKQDVYYLPDYEFKKGGRLKYSGFCSIGCATIVIRKSRWKMLSDSTVQIGRKSNAIIWNIKSLDEKILKIEIK